MNGAIRWNDYSFDLRNRKVVVVGSGTAAEQHVSTLYAMGACVTLFDSDPSPQVRALTSARGISLLERAYSDNDLAESWFVVACSRDPAVNLRVAADAERFRIQCHHPGAGDRSLENVPGAAHSRAPSHQSGRVLLVGGGPGDPDLITVRGQKALTSADVVVTDRLAPNSLLEMLPRHVLVIDAGKVPYGQQMHQETINSTIISHARAGKVVVRLKGGDPYVFGRGFEELQACAAAGIAVDVIPGITSAISVPSTAGFPVTHRGVNHEFVVVSGHVPPGHPTSLVNWKALASMTGTIVLMMAVENIEPIALELLRHGRPASTAVAAIQEGTLPSQRIIRSDLASIACAVREADIRPPAIIVLGPSIDVAVAHLSMDVIPPRVPCDRGPDVP